MNFAITLAISLTLLCAGQIAFADDAPPGDPPGQAPPNSKLDENGIPVGWMIIEGDIQVPADWFINIPATFEDNLWTNGVVPFRFDANVSAANQQIALNAMSEWASAATISFIPQTSQFTFIHIRDSSGDPNPGNNSPVGMGFGQRTINITSWFKFTIAHELAHSLGYWHEQSRTDRDTFVQIHFENVCQDCCGGDPCDHNFEIESSSSHYGIYDFDSIMHYDQFAFSNNGQPTIVVLPPNESWQNLIGQPPPVVPHLSVMNKMTMSFLYPQPNWRFLSLQCDIFNAPGTFLHPFCLFNEAYAGTPAGGMLWIQPGFHSVPSPIVLDKPMTIRAPLGGVTVLVN